jgi:hypothetical protein
LQNLIFGTHTEQERHDDLDGVHDVTAKRCALSGQLEQAARSGNPSAHFGWVASYQTEPQLTLTCAL